MLAYPSSFHLLRFGEFQSSEQALECLLKPEGVKCGELGQGHALLFLVFGIENAESEACG